MPCGSRKLKLSPELACNLLATVLLHTRRQQLIYQVSAIAMASAIFCCAVGATWIKFYYPLPPGAPFPWMDMLSTLALVVGGAVSSEHCE